MTTRPAIKGWFTHDDDGTARLVGTRGNDSGSYFFPPTLATSANPHRPSEEKTETLLSSVGTVWSWTTNHYPPPQPYVAPDPFVPYTVVAVELETEQMVVLGLLADGVDPTELSVGLRVQLDIETLFTDDNGDHTVWKWRPETVREQGES